jgi:hypothetical protein
VAIHPSPEAPFSFGGRDLLDPRNLSMTSVMFLRVINVSRSDYRGTK